MKKSVKVKFLCVLLVSLFAFATPYQAQALGIPVLDTSSFVQAIKQTISAIKESKVVVGIITTVKKTSAAIGTAKATVSEYVIKNKEKIEAKVEKVKKYKERAEEYKKEYEAYKAMLDENIAKAKEMKEMAEQKYNQAQDTVNKVKDTVGTVKDTANAAIDMAKNKADDIKDKADEVKTKIEDVSDKVAPSTRRAFEPQTQTEKVINPVKVDAVFEDSVDAVEENASKEVDQLRQDKEINSKQPMRRQVFTTSSLRQTESLVFAKAAILPNNGTDVNNTVVIPPALSKACGGISAEDALVKGTVDACLLKLNQERSGAQAYSGYGASKAFNRALAQYVAVGIAEAYKARQEADSFEEQYVDPIDMAIENNVRDIYADIVQMNRAIDMQMNNLLKIYSTQLVTRALYNYDKYMFLPAEKKDE